MSALTPYLATMTERAQLLALLVAASYVLGGIIAPQRTLRILQVGAGVVDALGRKLDKPHRGVATLVYRGIIAVMMLLVPAIFVGTLLTHPLPWVQLPLILLLFLWFSQCFATWPIVALLKRAKADGLPLELPGLAFLFADSHAVIRYLIAWRMEAFAAGIVGGCFWYTLSGWMGMLPYLVLGVAAARYRPRLAFGWAARSLFALCDALPRLIARTLLALAALFTPGARPIRGLTASSWRGAVAATLDCALGGPSPSGELPWAGRGTARVEAEHLQRALILQLAMGVWLVLLLASPTVYKLLITVI